MTHLPAPALHPTPQKLSVVSPIRPRPLHQTAPPPRVAFRPPPRMATPLDLSPPTPSSTAHEGVLMGIDSPRVPPPQQSPNVPTTQTTALIFPKAAPWRCSPLIAALNIQRQYIRKEETAYPPDVESDEEATPANNARSKTATRQST